MMRFILVACLGVLFHIFTMQTVFASDAAAGAVRNTPVVAAPVETGIGTTKTSNKVNTKKEKVAAAHAGVNSKQAKVVERGDQKAPAQAIATEKHFDMDALIERIKESKAIGTFTKLALRSDALDMVDLIKAYRRQANRISLDEVRARFDGLLLKVLALLDDDPVLSRDISMSREGIWNSLLEVKA